MQKKYLLILGLLLIFITGCKVSPFNVEAEVNYVSHEIKGDTIAAKKIEVNVSLGNAVYIDRIKEVSAIVNGTAVKLKFDNAEINDTNKKIAIYAFVKSDGVSIAPLSANVIKIDSITMQDENDNEITMKGSVPEIKINEGSTGTTDEKMSVVDGLKVTVMPDNTIQVSWTAHPSALIGYIVYKYTATAEPPVFEADKEMAIITAPYIVTTSTTNYTDKNVVVGNTYFYRVVAVKSATEVSPKQTTAFWVKMTYSTTTPTEIPIPKVLNLAAVPDVDKVLLSWDNLSIDGLEIVGYNIYAVTGMGTTNEKVFKLQSTNSPHVVKNNNVTIYKGDKFVSGSEIYEMRSGERIFFRVAAVGSDGREGSKSDAAATQMYDSDVTVLQAARDIRVVPYGNDDSGVPQTKLGVKLEWTLQNGIDKYIIERSDNGTDFSAIETIEKSYEAGKTGSTIDGSFLEMKNKKAYYRIRCVSTTGAIGRPSGTVVAVDYENMLIPTITTRTQMLLLSSAVTSGGKTTYTFAYVELNEDGTIKKAAEVTGLPLDFAGYKIYMSNEFDGIYKLAGKVDSLWGAQVVVDDLDVIPTKRIYVRCSTYDFFGNESEVSLKHEVAVSNAAAETIQPVTGLTATAQSKNSIKLSWNANSNAKVGYIVYRYKTSGANPIFDETAELPLLTAPSTISTTMTTYTDTTNVTPGNTYFYRVVAVKSSTEKSEKQETPVSVTIDSTAIPQVKNVTSGVSDIEKTTISWEAVTVSGVDILGYNIYLVEGAGTINEKYYKLKTTSTPNIIKSTSAVITAGMKFTDGSVEKTLNAGEDILLKIAAVGNDGNAIIEGAKSDIVKVYMLSNYTEAVSGLAAKLEGDVIAVTWTANTNAELGYKVYRAEADIATPIFLPSNETALLTAPSIITTTGTQYVDRNIVPDKVYFYRVEAYKTPTLFTPKQAQPVSVSYQLSAVSGLSASLQGDKIKITWNADSNALQGYKLYRMAANIANPIFDEAAETELLTVTGTEYTDSSIVPDKVYFYRVIAQKTNTIATPKQIQPVSIAYQLSAVSGLAATLQDDEIKVSWTADSNALQGYKLYRMEADGATPIFNSASEVEVGSMSSTEYTDSNIVPDKVYFYRVTALRSNTVATPKQAIPVSIKYSVTIGKVSNVSKGETVGVDESTITWETPSVANSELVGYNIYLTDTTGVGEVLHKLNNSQNPNIGKSNSYTITKSMEFGTAFYLTSGKERYVRVAAVVKAGTVLKEGPKSDPVKLEIYDSSVTIIQNAKDITVSPYGNDAAEQGNFGVYVAWPAKASKYILERSFDSKVFTEIYRGSTVSYIDSRFLENKVVSGDTTGYYRIRCIDAAGKIGLPSAVARITDYKEEDAPDISSAESHLEAAFAASKFTFSYKKADNVTDVTPTHVNDFAGYKIYMSTVYDGKYVLVGKIDDLRGGEITAAQMTAAGIVTTGQVWVRVSIYDLFGNEGELSLKRRIQ